MKLKVAFFLLIFSMFSAFSNGLPTGYFTVSERIEDVKIFLLTIGPGPHLDQRFGHTLLRIEDPHSKKIHNLNWGTFSLKEPNLAWKFFSGHLNYWLSNWPSRFVEWRYQNFENRRLVKNEIFLNDAQKLHLMELLKTNFEPQNLYFTYDFFFKNCSTIPRDYLDLVLGGAIKERLSRLPSVYFFRDYVRSQLANPGIMSLVLEVILNSEVDHSLTKWEESFFPQHLKDALKQIPSHLSPSGVILGPDEVLNSGYLTQDSKNRFGIEISIILLAFVLLALLLSRNHFISPLHKSAFRIGQHLWGSVNIIWGLFSGILGLAMVLAWIFSDHEILTHNANLLLFWPLDFIFVIHGCRLFKPNLTFIKGSFPVFVYALSFCHLIGVLCAVVLTSFHMISQDMSVVLKILVPPLQLIVFLHIVQLRVRFSQQFESLIIKSTNYDHQDALTSYRPKS